MSLDEVVDLTITTVGAGPTRAGFGTPLLMAYHDEYPDLLRTYTKLTELTDDGFAVSSPAYRMAQAAFSQNPKPKKVVVGKRTSAYSQFVVISPKVTTVGYKYSFQFVDNTGVVTTIEYVVQFGDTVNLICVALAALLDPLLDVSAVASPAPPNATNVNLIGVVGKLFNLKNLPRPAILQVRDSTPDPGIAADLSAIEAENDLDWYGIVFDHTSKASAVAAAAWVEARRKVAFVNTSDFGVLDGAVTDDVCSQLKAAAYKRTEVLGSYKELLSYSATAWVGRMLPTDPGSATWSFKTLAGITADVLTGGQKAIAVTKRLNTYTTLGGLNVTQWGQSPDGGYIDIKIGEDWLYARIQEAVYQVIQANEKIPYTDAGTDIIRNTLLRVLKEGIRVGFLAPDPEPVITIPKVADIDIAEKLLRNLPDVNFEAYLAGAIHTVKINGALLI